MTDSMFQIDRADDCIWLLDKRTVDESPAPIGFHLTPRQAVELGEELVAIGSSPADKEGE